jgi:RimJ/RimL family protein N-acetyltransferase
MQNEQVKSARQEFEERILKERSDRFPMDLPHGIKACVVERSIVRKFMDENFKRVFPESFSPRVEIPAERKRMVAGILEHHAQLHSESLLFTDGDTPIGWFTGECQDMGTFYIRNLGFFPEYRSRGYYTAFLPKYLDYLTSLGYERVTSQHKPNNAAVLIPHLRAGFSIMAVELEERWGPLVRLVYHTQAYRREVFDKLVL